MGLACLSKFPSLFEPVYHKIYAPTHASQAENHHLSFKRRAALYTYSCTRLLSTLAVLQASLQTCGLCAKSESNRCPSGQREHLGFEGIPWQQCLQPDHKSSSSWHLYSYVDGLSLDWLVRSTEKLLIQISIIYLVYILSEGMVGNYFLYSF